MRFNLNNVRLSFTKNKTLWIPEPFKLGDPPKFKASFLVANGDPQQKMIMKAIIQTLEEKYPGKGNALFGSIRTNPNKCCWIDGNTRTWDGYANHYGLSASRASKPLVVDQRKNILEQKDGKPYDGCYVNASLALFAYNNTGIGVACELRVVQFLRDGDAFSGGAPLDLDEVDELDVSEETSVSDDDLA